MALGAESDQLTYRPMAPASLEEMARFQRALRVLEGKWKREILWHLSWGTKRFGELRRLLPGITQHMLTLRLRELEAAGMITRTVYPEVPPRVEYSITKVVGDLRPMFMAMLQWADKYESSLDCEDELDTLPR